MEDFPTIRVGDKGTKLRLAVIVKDPNAFLGKRAFDLSTALTLQMTLRRPDGTVVIKQAFRDTEHGTHAMFCLTAAGDITLPGLWFLQGHIELPTGAWATSEARCRVLPKIQAA